MRGFDLTQSGFPGVALCRLWEHARDDQRRLQSQRLKCYRVAQKALDQDVRRTLLDLAVQWRELAAQIERLQWENAPEPALPGGQPTLH